MRTLPPPARRRGLATWLTLALCATGCEFFAEVDRGVLDAGGASGGAGSGGAGSTSSSASSSTGGPDVMCVLGLDCPGADTDCTRRTCVAGHCGAEPVVEGTPTSTQVSGDCKRSVCDGKGGEHLVDDDADVPVDGNPCTDDRCTGGVLSNPPSTASTPCDIGGGKLCDGVAHCVECLLDAQCSGGLTCFDNACVTCFDKTKDGTETDVDCGGPSCAPCPDARHCAGPADCQSKVCAATVCQAATCSDHALNGTETDVDCGGTCLTGCTVGQGCLVDADCKGGSCAGGTCAPTCSDGTLDGAETDVDCGGACPTGCGPGQVCAADADCKGGVCAGGECAPTCSDGVKNSAETGADCGGPTCGPCALGLGCAGNGDCQSGACHLGACVGPGCADGLVSPGETDVDCGGPLCPACGAGQGCAVPADCAAPTTCGGGNPGTPNVCGCTPAPIAVTCVAVQCGPVAGNCGVPVTCPDTCAAPLTCGSGAPGAPNLCGCPLALGCRLNTTFAKRYGGLLDDDGFALAVGSSGLLVGGSTSTSIDFGGGALTSAGAKDAVVSKLDLAGGHVWSKIYGDSHTQITRALGFDTSGNALIGVDFGGDVDFGGGVIHTAGGTDVAVVKLDPAGNHLWSKGFGDPAAQAIRGVAADAAGDVFVAGFYQGAVDFGGGALPSQGGADIYLLKLTPGGAHVWSKSFGDAAAQTTSALAVDGAGNSFITGQIAGTVGFGGTMVATVGGGDAFVAAFDPAGATRWVKVFGDAAAQSGNALAVDASGNVLVGGAFQGTINLGGSTLTSTGSATNDAFLAKLDGLGNHLWSVRFGDALDQAINGVAVDGAGNVLATGSFSGSFDCGTGTLTSAGATDVFVVKYSPAGACLQARRYGNNNAGAQVGRAVAADAAGNAYVFGDFTGTLDVDLGALTTADTKLDQLLLKLTP